MKFLGVAACSTAVVFSLAIAGCGSSDDSSDSSSDTSITKAQFVAQANAICKDSNKTVDAAVSASFTDGKKPTQAETETLITDSVIPAVDQQLQDLKALPVPEGEDDNISEILDAVDKGLEEAKADPSSLASQGSDPFGEANKLANAYGMTDCGS